MKTLPRNLYLIPTLLGDTPPVQVLPEYNLALLRRIDVYVAEELKTARRFLRKCGYSKNFDEETTFFILNEHTPADEIISFLEPAEQGMDIGLLSEAGCPAVADPGSGLVRIAHERGIRVIPLSGPSSIIMSLMASGLNGQHFTFHGYLPVKPNERSQKLKELERDSLRNHSTQIFIETPYRNRQMLEAILSSCSNGTTLCMAINISLPDEIIVTRTVREWRSARFEVPRQPAVFLISA